MTAPLYQLTGSYQQLLEAAEQGEDVGLALSQITDAIEAKGAALARVLACLEADAQAFGAEEKRLAARRKAAVASYERIREEIRVCMIAAGIRKIKGGSFTLTLAAGQDKVVITDEGKLSGDLVRIKVSREPDKKAILALYKDTGEIPEGVEIVETTTLRIR